MRLRNVPVDSGLFCLGAMLAFFATLRSSTGRSRGIRAGSPRSVAEMSRVWLPMLWPKERCPADGFISLCEAPGSLNSGSNGLAPNDWLCADVGVPVHIVAALGVSRSGIPCAADTTSWARVDRPVGSGVYWLAVVIECQPDTEDSLSRFRIGRARRAGHGDWLHVDVRMLTCTEI